MLLDASVRQDIQRLHQLPELGALRQAGSGVGNTALAFQFIDTYADYFVDLVGGSEKAEQASQLIHAFTALHDVYRTIDSWGGNSGGGGDDGGDGGGGDGGGGDGGGGGG
jgi:uncharacterized membrane protein YgcG